MITELFEIIQQLKGLYLEPFFYFYIATGLSNYQTTKKYKNVLGNLEMWNHMAVKQMKT